MKYYYIYLLFLAVSLLSCKKSTTGPNDTQKDFLVHIQVTNSSNQPVSGLRISMWNVLFASDTAKITTAATTSYTSSASTSIEFALAKVSDVSLTVTELNDKPFSTILTGIKKAGMFYHVITTFSTSWGTHVYKCQLAAIDTATDSVSTATTYLVLHQPNPAVAVFGYTSSTGSFETTDSLCFPNLFTLPPLTRTTENSSDSTGIFSIPDSVQICLTDTSSGLSQVYSAVIKGGENIMSLKWNPTSSSSVSSVIHKNSKCTTSILPVVIPVNTPTNTKLYQNYPNPFN
jgi:hypothetical protein